MRTNWVERLWIDGPWRTPFQLHELSLFKQYYDLRGASRVLEIGCGRGVGALLILKHFDPAHVEAVDIDPSMIRRAERRITPSDRRPDQLSHRRRPGPLFSRAERHRCCLQFRHHPPPRGLGARHREVARVLMPGGIFYSRRSIPPSTPLRYLRHILVHPKENRFDGEQYRAALAREGLSLIDGYRESRYTIIGAAIRAE